MKSKTFDVIVIGAGPSGSTLAAKLAESGFNTLLLEKCTLPRYKVCGGGITKRALMKIPINIDSIIRDEIRTLKLSVMGNKILHFHQEDPFIYSVMRNELDFMLASYAVKCGVTLLTDETVKHVVEMEDLVKIETENETYYGKYVVGADGVNSLVAKQSGLMKNKKKAIALELELNVSDAILTGSKSCITIDYGVVKNGYAWIFPKGDHLSVGIGSYSEDHQTMQSILQKFMAINHLSIKNDDKVKGSFLSAGGKKQKVVSNRIALIGDAAGLVEPFGGEGIYYALWSGELLFKRLQSVLLGNVNNALELYQYDVDLLIIPEFKNIKKFATLFYKNPPVTQNLLSHYPNVVNAGFDFIKGESSHGSLLKTFLQALSAKQLLKIPF